MKILKAVAKTIMVVASILLILLSIWYVIGNALSDISRWIPIYEELQRISVVNLILGIALYVSILAFETTNKSV